jgi:hypothetical protein
VRYSYVEPAREVRPAAAAPGSRPGAAILKRAAQVALDDPVVPADTRRLVNAAREARPQWTFKLTHSVTLNDARNAVLHHVFVRVYGRAGEPLGYCGWTAGHTVGGHIWRDVVDPLVGGTTYRQVGITEFAAWARNQPYEPPRAQPVPRGICPACDLAEVRVKQNGIPYSHRDPATDTPCTWRVPYRLIGEAV